METRDGGERHIFAGNRSDMIEIDNECYWQVAGKTASAIGCREFFSGTVECIHAGFCSTFTATLLIYRSCEELLEGRQDTVSDIAAVWWEFTTTIPAGADVPNDFSFSDFRRYLLEYFRTEVL